MLVTLVVLADLAVAAPPATRPAAAWATRCAAALERANDQYAARRGQRARILVTTVPDERRACICDQDIVRLEVPSLSAPDDRARYTGGVSRSDWHSVASPSLTELAGSGPIPYERRADGRMAWLEVPEGDPGVPLIVATFRSALDACFATAPPPAASPAEPLPPPDDGARAALCAREAPAAPPAACKDAELAAFELEHACDIEDDYISTMGHDGRRGRTRPALARIGALGAAAEPILLRLSRSANPTARAAAAVGLHGRDSAGARAALERLAHDDAKTPHAHGWMPSDDSVSSFTSGDFR